MEPANAKICRAYAKDIEEALIYGWPWEEIGENYKREMLKVGIRNPSNYIPVDEVLFETRETGPVHAEDLDGE